VPGPADIAQPLPLLRSALASLGFAALALPPWPGRPGSPRTLLQELKMSRRQSRRFGRSGRRSSGTAGYLRELGRGEQGL
jgi:hypothetical protein